MSTPELGTWRWESDDTFDKDAFRKEAMFITFWAAYYFFVHYKVSELWASVVILLVIVAWEVKDALVPWELAGWIGGGGFSYWDVAYGSFALVLALVTDLIVPPHIRPTKKQLDALEEE